MDDDKQEGMAQAAMTLNRMVTNEITSRTQLLNSMMDPRRDINAECGYPTNITAEQYRIMYDREIGKRVVNVYPEETWKKFPKVYEDDDVTVDTAFEDSLEAFEAKHHLFHYMQRIDELSGIGHYGVILWGLDDGKQLHEPVEGWESWEVSTGKPRTEYGQERTVLYLRALDESLVRISSYESNVTSPRYGMPNTYTITLSDPRNQESSATAAQPSKTDTTVHWTRISHIADNRKTSEVIGTPRQECVWNRLYDSRKVLGGSGEMYWKGGFPGISLETLPGLENAVIDEEATKAVMSDYMNGLERYISLNGMKANSLAPQIADPTSTFDVQIKAICITLGVPFRVFMGIEEGVVSGDQATQAWAGRLENRQTRYVTPMLIDPIIQRLVDFGALAATVEPQGWTVKWPDLTAPDEKDKAEVAVKKTEALSKYIGGNVDTLVPPMAYLTKVCGYEEAEAEAILEAAIEHLGELDGDGDTPGREPGTPEPEEPMVPAAPPEVAAAPKAPTK